MQHTATLFFGKEKKVFAAKKAVTCRCAMARACARMHVTWAGNGLTLAPPPISILHRTSHPAQPPGHVPPGLD